MVLSSGEPLWPLLLKAPAVGVAEGKVTGIGQKVSGELNLPTASHFRAACQLIIAINLVYYRVGRQQSYGSVTAESETAGYVYL